MKKQLVAAFILAATSTAIFAQDMKPAVKGTICFASNGLRNLKQLPLHCAGLGNITSINEIYERGYRVVSSGTEVGGLTNFFIIEQRN